MGDILTEERREGTARDFYRTKYSDSQHRHLARRSIDLLRSAVNGKQYMAIESAIVRRKEAQACKSNKGELVELALICLV